MSQYTSLYAISEYIKLSPNEYYKFVAAGIFPLDIPNTSELPNIQKKLEELGVKPDNN